MAILSTINFVVSEETKKKLVRKVKLLATKFNLNENELVELPDFYLEFQR